MKGKFVTMEGPEGSGKSTQSRRLVAALDALGLEVLYTREPGGTRTGDMIRDILQHDASGEPISATAELLLFASSRAQLVNQVIQPALARGAWVVCDRFIDSTTAYQGYGRGFPIEQVEGINRFATGGLLPDVTFLLNVGVALGAARMRERYAGSGQTRDRFEREEVAYHERVHLGYLKLAAEAPERIRIIDASRSEACVFDEVWAVIQTLRGDVS